MEKVFIVLGHPAYGGTNALAVCKSKTAAVANLMERGSTRAAARAHINAIIFEARGRYTTSGGKIFHGPRGMTECSVYLDGTLPYGWYGQS